VRVLRFIIRNWPLKIGAVMLAAILYGAMVVLQNTAAWPGAVAIDVVNQPADSYLVQPNPMRAVTGIRYIAPPDVPVSQSSFRAAVDLTAAKVSESDSSLVRVKLVADDARIQIIDYQPQQINVQLDPVVHKQVNVQVFEGNLPSGLQPGPPVLGLETVDVKGPASFVRRVAYAQAPVRIDASGLDINEDVDLVARDASDVPVGNVVFNPRTVHVQIQVGSQLRTETVPVNPARSIVGAPAAGYYITSIEVKPSVVSVQGQADALALLKGSATTKPVSIAGATSDVTVKVDLDLPSGVSSGQVQSISVVVHLASPATTRSVSVGVVPTGARPDRIYTLSTPSVIVTLGGATASLNAFDTSTLVGTVSVGDLDVGAHTIKISVGVPAGITVVTISPFQITVTVASAPTPSPPPLPAPVSPVP
jgi:YbbR domain-containing protein